MSHVTSVEKHNR